LQSWQKIITESRFIDERADRQDKGWPMQRNAGIEHANKLDVNSNTDYGRNCHHR
jgi:hypothetical protein